eukprot:scaffold209779_cov19-Prasinocladus_malaysianus.AAC.1
MAKSATQHRLLRKNDHKNNHEKRGMTITYIFNISSGGNIGLGQEVQIEDNVDHSGKSPPSSYRQVV